MSQSPASLLLGTAASLARDYMSTSLITKTDTTLLIHGLL